MEKIKELLMGDGASTEAAAVNPDLLLTPKQFCDKFSACAEGGEFATGYATMREVWEACPNPQWLMWICDKLGIKLDDKTNRLFACWCVRNTPLSRGRATWDLLTDERSRNAVEVAERFAYGLATSHELSMARGAAWAARGPSVADSEGAAKAAVAVAEGAAKAAGAVARAAAEGAAKAAAWAAAECAVMANSLAWAAWAVQANELRKHIANPFPL